MTSSKVMMTTANRPLNSTSQSAVVIGFFEKLAKSLNVSMSTLMLIIVACIIGLVIILAIIIFCIKKRSKDKNQSRGYNKGNQIVINEADFLKYESEYGFIDFTIMYDRKRKTLKVQNLIAGNINNIGSDIPDCYLKIYMLNEEGKKVQLKKTKTIEDNPCPNFGEIFTFKIDVPQDGVLYFQLIDENKNGNDCPIGDGKLVLEDVPLEKYIGYVCPVFVILGKPSEKIGCGDVCVILTYSFNKLSITILEAKDLKFQYERSPRKGENRYPSVYATLRVFVKGHQRKTFKTKWIENTMNPYFFETFTVDISLAEISLTHMKIEIHESIPGRITKRIGRACIGNQSYHQLINELGQRHLYFILENWKTPHAMWHSLITG